MLALFWVAVAVCGFAGCASTPQDVSRDKTYVGAYVLGQEYQLVQPAFLMIDDSLWPVGRPRPAYLLRPASVEDWTMKESYYRRELGIQGLVPAATKLKFVKAIRTGGKFGLDPSSHLYAVISDGEFTGRQVLLTFASASRDAERYDIDPAYLAPVQ